MDIFAVVLDDPDRMDAMVDVGAKLAPSQDIAGTKELGTISLESCVEIPDDTDTCALSMGLSAKAHALEPHEKDHVIKTPVKAHALETPEKGMRRTMCTSTQSSARRTKRRYDTTNSLQLNRD